MRILLTAFLAFVLNACDPSLASQPGPPEPMDLPSQPMVAFASTDEVVKGAELRRLVDALGAFNSVESSHVGAAGSPSKSWAAWDAVKKAASHDELIALTGHVSATVRGYAAQHLARTEMLDAAAQAGWLERVLRDEATVGTTQGCMVGDSSVASLALDELCWNAADKVGARAVLERLAAGAGELAEQAKRCLPRK